VTEFISVHRKTRFLNGLRKLIRQPARFLDPHTWNCLLHLNRYLNSVDYSSSASWLENHKGEGVKRKGYLRYEDYLRHQKSKLDVKGKYYLTEYDRLFHDELLRRLQKLDDRVSFHGKTVLCLGARLGTEVRSFIDMGCFAVGLDLNPGTENKFVVFGDFHDIQFATESVAIVFTNSFDHVFCEERVIRELTRILHKGGFMILELPDAKEGKQAFGTYESLYWDDPMDVVRLFTKNGFEVLESVTIEYPWKGTHILLRLSEKA